MNDFNLTQMKQLLKKDNVSLVYLRADGDYWIEQQEFCNAFRSVQLTDNIVIHAQFEGLSLTNSSVVSAVEKIVKETGRDPSTVYIFSPNAIAEDSPWENLFWRQFCISDEFTRSKIYWTKSPEVEDNFKTWALFVGRQTTPRLLALYDIWHDSDLKDNFLLSVMNNSKPPTVLVFDDPKKTYDLIEHWIPVHIENKIQKIMQHNDFEDFCRNSPVKSIDGYSIEDQYANTGPGENRNIGPSQSLINMAGKYLFELTFETMTRGTTFTPSEKTVRTIVAKKPLVVYAPKNFLKNLQNIGFKTFDTVWDESYDQLEGPARYRAIMKIVKEISVLPKNRALELYHRSRVICDHNHDLLQEYTLNNGLKGKKFYGNNQRS